MAPLRRAAHDQGPAQRPDPARRFEQPVAAVRARDEVLGVVSLEQAIARVLQALDTPLPALQGLGSIGAAQLVVEVGDPRRFRSADAFASYTGTAPIPASSAEVHGHPVHHRLNRFGNRRLNAVLYHMAIARLRLDAETQA